MSKTRTAGIGTASRFNNADFLLTNFKIDSLENRKYGLFVVSPSVKLIMQQLLLTCVSEKMRKLYSVFLIPQDQMQFEEEPNTFHSANYFICIKVQWLLNEDYQNKQKIVKIPLNEAVKLSQVNFPCRMNMNELNQLARRITDLKINNRGEFLRYVQKKMSEKRENQMICEVVTSA